MARRFDTARSEARRRTGALAAVSLLAAGGCSSGGSPGAAGTASAPSASITAFCAATDPKLAKRIVHFPSADGKYSVEAYVADPGSGTGSSATAGSARVGIVVDHQSQQTLCDSTNWADTFATEGYLVVAPTLDESAQLTETEGAIAYLRAHGAAQIALIGASMGGTAVLQAAAEVRPPVQAVISLSGPEQYYPLDALATAPKLAVPAFYSAGADDNQFAIEETYLYNATTEKDKVLHIVQNTAAHGFDLLGNVLDLVNAFIRAHVR